MKKQKLKKKISRIETKTEKKISRIIAREQKSFFLFQKGLTKKQIKFIKEKIQEIIAMYPPFMRPFIMTWIVVAYCSIIPFGGTGSVLFWGGLGKLIQKIKNGQGV